MFNVCPACGEYCVEKKIDPAGPYAVCPACGHRHPFRRLPLFVVTGASGAGKSSACLGLSARQREVVCLETDILWRPELAGAEDGYRGYGELWLRVAKNVGQAGRQAALFGSATPERFERSGERRYFSAVHYLALVCEEEELVRRLRARPEWRGASSGAFVEEMRAFNRWYLEHADRTEPPMALLDTTQLSAEETVEHVHGWMRTILLPRSVTL